MAVQIQGNQSANINQESGSNSQIVTQRWPYIGGGGAYHAAGQTGAIAAGAAAGPLLAMRWSHPTKLAIISRLTVSCTFTVDTTAAANGRAGFGVYVATGFTTNYSTGAGIAALAASRKRTSYGASDVASIMIAGTAVMATFAHDALTRLVASRSAIVEFITASASASLPPLVVDLAPSGPYDHPLILEQNEGIVVTIDPVLANVGTVITHCAVEWLEVGSLSS